jgi:hypothetical protein
MNVILLSHPDDGHTIDRNILVKNNMGLNIFMNMHLLGYRASIQHSLMHEHGPHKVEKFDDLRINHRNIQIELIYFAKAIAVE